jgi:hypothetical protein
MAWWTRGEEVNPHQSQVRGKVFGFFDKLNNAVTTVKHG